MQTEIQPRQNDPGPLLDLFGHQIPELEKRFEKSNAVNIQPDKSPHLHKRSLLAKIKDTGVERVFMNELKAKRLATEMIETLLIDIGYIDSEEPETDLLGFSEKQREYRKLDSLIWVFGLNPDGAELSFIWACELTDYDPEAMRRIIAKNMRSELKQCLVVLASMVSFEYAKNSELELAEYINLSGWDSH